MLRDDENYVALFIDWDNLAISTAADFGGAIPDVRAIVRVAQRFGTILLARAYAEWQVPSDRLSVYRAGVDPIYAPTFRFEPDPVGGPPRGKSLADPCLVADCIDTLHLMPTVNHFILVSGDKDLIPIVRLVQLRGRKVVVVGPDYVAAILRDMADEYVSYRSLVESGETHSTAEQIQAGAGGPRRRGGRPVSTNRVAPSVAPSTAPATAPSMAPATAPATVPSMAPAVAPAASTALTASTQPAAPTSPAPQPAATPMPSRRESFRDRRDRRQQPSYYQPREVEVEEAPAEIAEELPTAVEPVAEESVETEAPAVEAPAASSEELSALWTTIDQILHEREAQGKPRLRATNLKDLLMARISSFSERRFGFHKFRDLLAAAEKTGAIEVNRTGPVHWVTLPRHHEGPAVEEEPAQAPAPELPAAKTEAPAAEPVEAAAPEAPATPPAESDPELVRFVVDLRNRSRWLTYTYVLTNMIAHLSERIAPQQADVEARNALNRLVQQGVLRVDREPREIEVAGARHRVRMCHLEESHPLVQAVLAEAPAETPAAPAAEAPSAPEPAPIPAPAREARQPEREPRQPEREARQPEREPRQSDALRGGRESRDRRERRPARQAQPPRVILPFLQPATPPEPEVAPEAEEAPVSQPAAESTAAAAEPGRPASGLSPLPNSLLAPSTSGGLTPVNPTGAPAAAETAATEEAGPAEAVAEAPTEDPSANGAEPNGAESKTPLVQAFEALREVIRAATGPDKPFAGAASVKTRLARRLGEFDERSLGFGKFKDFLLAAQREGYVRVESSGPATRVSLPER